MSRLLADAKGSVARQTMDFTPDPLVGKNMAAQRRQELSHHQRIVFSSQKKVTTGGGERRGISYIKGEATSLVVLLMRVDGAKVLGLLEQREAQNATHVPVDGLQQGQLKGRSRLGAHGHVGLEGFRPAKYIAEGHRSCLHWAQHSRSCERRKPRKTKGGKGETDHIAFLVPNISPSLRLDPAFLHHIDVNINSIGRGEQILRCIERHINRIEDIQLLQIEDPLLESLKDPIQSLHKRQQTNQPTNQPTSSMH